MLVGYVDVVNFLEDLVTITTITHKSEEMRSASKKFYLKSFFFFILNLLNHDNLQTVLKKIKDESLARE